MGHLESRLRALPHVERVECTTDERIASVKRALLAAVKREPQPAVAAEQQQLELIGSDTCSADALPTDMITQRSKEQSAQCIPCSE